MTVSLVPEESQEKAVADIPIIMSAPMVDAIRAGRKTMTRRLAWEKEREVKPGEHCDVLSDRGFALKVDKGGQYFCSPPSIWQRAKPGDRLWIRESHWRWGMWDYQPSRKEKWRFFPDNSNGKSHAYDGELVAGYKSPKRTPGKLAWWRRPSIFMPREISRLTLVLTTTKLEPLQNVSEADAIAR